MQNLKAIKSNLATLSHLARDVINNSKLALTKENIPGLAFAGIGLLGLSPIFKLAYDGLVSLLAAKSLKRIKAEYGASVKEGETSWVLVTGATDGIGKAFCQTFASLGFNIILISRTQERLDSVAEELRTLNPQIKTKTIAIDFSETFTKEGLSAAILPEIQDLDISILINNVGVGKLFPSYEISYRQIYEYVNVNLYSQFWLTQLLMPKLIERAKTHKTGIINLSSMLGLEHQLPGLAHYSSTKACIDYFTKALANEYPNIDILSVRPGQVKTKMNTRGTATPEDHVKCVLRFLGSKKETVGNAKFAIEGTFVITNFNFIRRVIRKAMYRAYEENYKVQTMEELSLQFK